MKRYLTAFTAITALLAVGACEDDDDDMTGPDPILTGSIQVNASTTGALLDADGYEARVVEDTLLEEPSTIVEPEDQDLAINGSTTFDAQATGAHLVELRQVAPNCTVAGENPRSVTVNEDETTVVDFDVTCVDTSGSLEVSVTTTGAEPDADGYTVDIGAETSDVAANDVATFDGLLEGDYAVELTGLAENCSVTGDNPATVTITEGLMTSLNFAVDCPTTST